MTTAPITLITGGGQGIGKACARQFLELGHTVLIADWDAEAGEQTVADYLDLGDIRYLRCDISHEPEVMSLALSIGNTFGRLDHLINNAAISVNKPIAEQTLEEWNWVLSVNLTAPWLCAKYLSPLMLAQGGSIVNIASTRAHMSEADTAAYSASKGGLLALTHSLAMSLGPDIRVNSISPGWIDLSDWTQTSTAPVTPPRPEDHAFHPVGRVGRPEDIAAMAAYLCSTQAGFITGQDFVMDGGMTKKMIYLD